MPNLTRGQLANGLHIVMAPHPEAAAVAVAVIYNAGFRSEKPAQAGLAHLCEHLMFQGSPSLDRGRHAALVSSNGGLTSARTYYDYTGYFEVLPASELELAIFLEADRMRGVRLSNEALRREVQVVEAENRSRAGFPPQWLPMVLFQSWPNAHDIYGTVEDLEAITLDDVREFFGAFYFPNNAVLAVSGGFNPGEAIRLVDKHFGGIQPGLTIDQPDLDEPVLATERHEVRHTLETVDAGLAIGFRTPHPQEQFEEYCALILAAAALGEGWASRLSQRLVQHDRLATDVTTEVGFIGDSLAVRHPSMIRFVAWHPRRIDAEQIIASVDDECGRLAQGIPAAELDRVRNSFVATQLRSIDDAANRALHLGVFEALYGNAEMINLHPGVMAMLTPTRVSEVAARWLLPRGRAVLRWQPTPR
jgi:predicted Zn-dependent peptidase